MPCCLVCHHNSHQTIQEKFPKFNNVRGTSCEVKSGEMLYLPAGWFHEVTSYSTNVNANMMDGTSGDNNNELNAEEDDLVSTMECSYTPLALVVTQIFYFSIFHTLANLPLHDRLLYGIHQRFWMQPNVLLFLLGGVGFDAIMRYFLTSSPLPLFSSSRGNSKKQKMILLQKKQQKMKNQTFEISKKNKKSNI